MSYRFTSIPLKDIQRLSIVFAEGRTMAQVKAAVGCDAILNGGFYNMTTGKPVAHLRVGGKVYAAESWGSWGYAWDAGPDIQMVSIPAQAGDRRNYITCLALLTPWDGPDAKLSYPAALGGLRPRSAMALTDDGSLMLFCTDSPMTPEALRQKLHKLGAVTAMMLDSGGSSQCDFGGDRVIRSTRRVNNYICVWKKKKEETPVKKEEEEPVKPIICLDPGHDPGCVNGSPDGTYKEVDFAWDMAQRLKPLLEARGVKVILTRVKSKGVHLRDRAKVSNAAGADLFVSLHSNAAGNNGWYNAHGLMIYTSVAGDQAGRNRCAKAILERMRAAGVDIHGSGLAHNGYTVLTATTAPAVLIEHGFHTNREDVALLKDSAYRDKLAKATVDGICDYLDIAQAAEDAPEGDPDVPDEWAAAAWDKAKAAGVLDDTRPRDPVKRQELALVLDRLGLLK